MKQVDIRLPPTNRWLLFMLALRVDRPDCLSKGSPSLLSHWHSVAKEGFLVWNHAKVWYLGVGSWRVGGYAHDGSDADAVVARVLSRMLEESAYEQGG